MIEVPARRLYDIRGHRRIPAKGSCLWEVKRSVASHDDDKGHSPQVNIHSLAFVGRKASLIQSIVVLP